MLGFFVFLCGGWNHLVCGPNSSQFLAVLSRTRRLSVAHSFWGAQSKEESSNKQDLFDAAAAQQPAKLPLS